MILRITQRDVAREAGVSHVTVSLALRGDPTIPPQTRNRIEKIARELGYTPDPMLTALSSYRKQQRLPAFRANLAWLTTSAADGLSRGSDFRIYFEGARERAQQLGYSIEEINLGGEKDDFKRLHRLLAARNIKGLILAPNGAGGDEFKLDLSCYSAVRLGYSHRAPILNTVANAQFRAVLVSIQHIIELGYRRIGIILSEELDERTSWHFLGGFLASQHFLPKKDWIVPFYDSPGVDRTKAVHKWIKRQKIDCFIAAGGAPLYHALMQRGLKIPETVGYVDTQIDETDSILSGIHQNPRQVGQAAINLLVNMLDRSETGVPSIPSHHLIEGSWREGTTVMLQKTMKDTGNLNHLAVTGPA